MVTSYKKSVVTLVVYLSLIIQVDISYANSHSRYEIAQTLPLSVEFESEHFIFRLYDDLDKGSVSMIVDGLNNNYDRIVNALGSDYVPKTYVHLFGDKESWQMAMPA